MPASPSPFVNRCRQLKLATPQSAAAAQAQLALFHVDTNKFSTSAAKLEAVATLIYANNFLKERNGRLYYNRWSKLTTAEQRAIRSLYDVPPVHGRPPSLAAIAQHYWDNRPGAAPAPARQAAPVSRRAGNTDPAIYQRRPIATDGSVDSAADDDEDVVDGVDAEVHVVVDGPGAPASPPAAAASGRATRSQPAAPRAAQRAPLAAAGSSATRLAPATSLASPAIVIGGSPCDAAADVIIALLPTEYRAVFDRTIGWSLEQRRRLMKLVSTPPQGAVSLLSGNDMAVFTYRLSLIQPAPPACRALEDGKLIAEAARYPIFGSTGRAHYSVLNVHLRNCQSTWSSTLALLLNPSAEITASALARLKNIVIEWFADRKAWMESQFSSTPGLEELPRHARRQERELKDLFALHEAQLYNAQYMPAAWSPNRTWFHLFMPFFNEHVGVPSSPWVEPAPSAGFGTHVGPLGAPPAYQLPPPAPTTSFLGRPASSAIVGTTIAIRQGPPVPCRFCSQPGHSSWECPRHYYTALGECCPGFDAQGNRVVQDWHGGELVDAAKANWIRYIRDHNLTRSKQVQADVRFN